MQLHGRRNDMRWRLSAIFAAIALCLVIGSPPAQADPIFNDTGPCLTALPADTATIMTVTSPLENSGVFIDNTDKYPVDTRLNAKELVAASAHRYAGRLRPCAPSPYSNRYVGPDLRRQQRGLSYLSRTLRA